ncbi:MAG: hypothetical protein A2033_13230 [Bacteroidetes bacterium GWA2_31_9]|nr:MAG: hypothetical protein A2033_13230 [Bacteroidetes bacterium GWA2_31_9]
MNVFYKKNISYLLSNGAFLLVLFTFLISFFLILPKSYSQVFYKKDAEKYVPNTSLVRLNEKSKQINFVKFNKGFSFPVAKADRWLLSTLNLSSKHNFILINQYNDKLGINHSKYNLYYNNIPVINNCFYIHSKNNSPFSANGEINPFTPIVTVPSISKDEAFNLAKNDVNAQLYKTNDSEVELVILPLENKYYLAYMVDIYSIKPLSRQFIYVDAKNGNILKKTNRLISSDSNGTAVTKYCGTRQITTDSYSGTYRLRESGRGGGIETYDLNNGSDSYSAVDFTDSDNYWNTTTNQDNAAYDAHFGAEMTYDYYFSNYGWNSYNNAGSKIYSYVHLDYNYSNAYWDGQGMYFGDGDGYETEALTSLDVVAHEFTHGVTEYSAGLIYSSESGALNESFSDIFGVVIDFYANPSTANYLMGDQFSLIGGAFRNMANPNQYQNPDTYMGTYWDPYEEVHCNSGVMNYWFYLLSEGGSGTNDIGNSFNVSGIGINNAAQIAFYNLTNYLTASSNYSDARFYSIQAAEDIFGACSAEVISVTNAWYAVGIGSLYTNAVIANFTPSQSYSCTVPATINFTNTSTNGSTYIWDFGDGTSSTVENPSHSYSSIGDYSVQLIVTGNSLCNSSDTVLYNNLITVTNSGGPSTPSCQPGTSSPGSCGISQFIFNTINNSSGLSDEGYMDFTCGNSTTVTEGLQYNITISTSSYGENVKVWIDINNNGQFNNTDELIYVSNNQIIHSGSIIIPATSATGVPLRMRVVSDYQNNTISDACYQSYYGQTEDYTVVVLDNQNPPVAHIGATSSSVNVGTPVQFNDMSTNIPTSWYWQFPGGTPSTSTLQNPLVTYSTIGQYDVSLRIANTYGVDSVYMPNYLSVLNTYTMCSATSSIEQTGIIYDSGGPSGDYQNGENCSFLISIPCASSITLSFSSFYTESCCDDLYIYDGTSSSSTLIYSAAGSTIPPDLTAYSGNMYLVFSSDGSVIASGFEASWTSVVPSGTGPNASFAISDNNPPLNSSVDFTDQSTNVPIAWLWNFGDGQTSNLQNPSHAFATSGSFNITLIVFNCFTSDTIINTLVVQQSPSYSVSPLNINVNLANCNDSITVPLTVTNSGVGELIVNIENAGNASELNILAMTYGVDLYGEYPNTISAINQYFTNYILTETSTISASVLQSALIGKDVLLVPEIESGSASAFTSLARVIQSFISNGGTAIFTGSYSISNQHLFNMGLFSGSSLSSSSYGNLNVIDPSSPLANSLPSIIPAQDATLYCNFTNSDAFCVVNYENILTNEVVTYRQIGLGKVIYIGYDYYSYDDNAARIISNAMFWAQSENLPNFITISPTTNIISSGSSEVFNVTLSTNGNLAGIYNTNLYLNTNDPLHPIDTVSVTMTITGQPEIALSASCINFGSVIQNATKTDSIEIINLGCDTLMISNLLFTNSDFSSPSNQFYVLPNDTATLQVSFNPSTLGSYSDTLYIYNNDINKTICLTGTATPPPVISVTPDSLFINFTTCNDSASVSLQISNSGGSTLEVIISDGTFISGTSTILEDDFESGINSSIWYATTATTSGDCGANSGYNSLYFNDGSSRYAETIDLELNNTAGVEFNLKFGSGSSPCENADSGEDVVLEYSTNGGYTWTILNTYLANNYDSYTHIYEPVPQVAITSSTRFKWRQVSFSGSGMDNWTIDDVNIWTEGNTGSLDTLNILSGDSSQYDMTFYSDDFASGQSSIDITLNTNDPLNSVIIIPCIVSNISLPCADFGYLTSGCSGIVSFTDSSSNTPLSWKWNFGDGTSSSFTQNPNHTYSQAGNYDVSLIVCNNFGCDTIIKQINIPFVGSLAATCTQTSYYSDYTGISNVDFNTINKTTTQSLVGYNDYSCENVTNLIHGQSYTLNISTFNYQNVKAWIDYNNNGTYETSEVIITSNNLNNHTASVLIPSSAVHDTRLRLRVVTDYSGYSINACTNVYYGEVEDYSVVIENPIMTPVAIINYSILNECSGKIKFNDVSGNEPTTWYWMFGDGTYSMLQNPIKNYSSNGTYTVTLLACNSAGCDSASQTITINNFSNLTLASCYPATVNPSSDNGIKAVYFNTLSNVTNDSLNDYMDYSCDFSTELFEGEVYSLTVITNSILGEKIVAYIDYNNNGIFSANELIMTSNSGLLHTENITIPNNAIFDTPLRLRIVSDAISTTSLSACNSPIYGQIEDYAVTIKYQNISADFSYNIIDPCNGVVSFSDNSSTVAQSWNWSFGNATTSTQQNPKVTYTSEGTYIVSLIVCNGVGCDTISKTIVIDNLSSLTSATCYPTTLYPSATTGIKAVYFNTIANVTNDSLNDYRDYSCFYTTNLTAGKTYQITISTISLLGEKVVAYIDYNNNGFFSTSEQIMTSSNGMLHVANILIPSVATFDTPLRLRIVSDAIGTPSLSACNNPEYGQVEDYAVTINYQPIVAGFTYDVVDICSGFVLFNDTTSPAPQSWLWSFGDGTTSSLQNPYHSFALAGIYNVILEVVNAYDTSTVTKSITINTISANINLSETEYEIGDTIIFTSNSIGANKWTWDFGDGETSIIESPTHVFDSSDVYNVKLIVENTFSCIDSTYVYINVINDFIAYRNNSSKQISVYPNPNNGNMIINLSGFENQPISIELFDISGRLVYNEKDIKLSSAEKSISFKTENTGIYWLKVVSEKNVFVKKVYIY